MRLNKRTILIHVIGCLAFLCTPVLSSPDFVHLKDIFYIPPFQREFISSVLLLVFFYLNYYYFIPTFFFPKRHVAFIVVIIVSYALIIAIPEVFIHTDIEKPPFQVPVYNYPLRHQVLFFLNHNLFPFLIIIAFSLTLKIKERLEQIETEKTNAELSYLKAQINPHFLFNTLNSIYSLAIQKNDQTADAVVKLSEMMRYVLTDGNKNFVPLESEIKYISNYIELQSMRLASNVELCYTCEGKTEGQTIAPLVLIPFIENAFKHGVNEEENSNIEIKILITKTNLQLFVKNNCVTINNDTLNKSGLGIDNTKQRLKLLYPQNYKLKIIKLEDCFTVNLSLNIHD